MRSLSFFLLIVSFCFVLVGCEGLQRQAVDGTNSRIGTKVLIPGTNGVQLDTSIFTSGGKQQPTESPEDKKIRELEQKKQTLEKKKKIKKMEKQNEELEQEIEDMD